MKGFTIIAHNYLAKIGELDFIARDADTLAIIEVRYRANAAYGSGAETVTPAKQRKIIRTTQLFLMRNPRLQNLPIRFDVACVSGAEPHFHVHYIPHAFEAY